MANKSNSSLPTKLQDSKLFHRCVGVGRDKTILSMGGYEALSNLSPNGVLVLNVGVICESEQSLDTRP